MNKLFFIFQQFIGSTQSSNFLISYNGFERDYPNFSLGNEKTGEVLALYTNPNQQSFYDYRQFLIRHPKGQEYLRQDWEEQLQQLYTKLPHVYIDIKGIGVKIV